MMLEWLDIQTVLVFMVVVLVTWWYWSIRLPTGFPPGPKGLPVLGAMIALAKHPGKSYLTMIDLAKKFGPVFGMKMGSYPTVVLNNYEVVKEALVKQGDKFTDHPQYLLVISNMFRVSTVGPIYGLIWTNGDIWRQSRHFALRGLRDFAIGKKSHEHKILEEAVSLCNELTEKSGKPFGNLYMILQECTNNIMCNVIYGSRFEKNDPDFRKLMQMQHDNFATSAYNSILNFVPFFRNFPWPSWYHKLIKNKKAEHTWMEEQIEKRRKVFDNKERNDFLDFYLAIENKIDQVMCPANMRQIIDDIYNGGSGTTTTGMHWLLLYMIRYPHIQTQCQKEIDHVIGSGRLPAAADMIKMHYINAVIHEALRLGNIVPLDMRTPSCDTTLNGYKIPKGTLVLMNMYAVHMDNDYWENPEEYYPERWLTPEGSFKKNEAFMPFSIGLRICPGEALAKMELFLLFGTLLQRFTFRMSDNANPPSMESTPGMTYGPQHYELIADPH